MMNFSFKIVSRKSMENIYLAILLPKFHQHTECPILTPPQLAGSGSSGLKAILCHTQTSAQLEVAVMLWRDSL